MNNLSAQPSRTFESAVTRASVVSIIGNLLLSVIKGLAGVIAHSGAMISDAVNSASDVLSSVIVIIGIRLSARDSDRDHPYGHERFECVAALILVVILVVTGFFIAHSALETLAAADDRPPVIPGVPAVIAAVVSILAKEALYRYTIRQARKYDSGSLKAVAWDHRSDALSSFGALIGIVGARMGFAFLEPVASLVICGFILKAAWDVFRDATGKMIDRACDPELEAGLRACASGQPGVLGVNRLRTRVFGHRIYVDMEIRADGAQTLADGHRLAEQTHRRIEREFPQVKHITVQVSPENRAV